MERRVFITGGLTLLVAGCGSSGARHSAPRNLDNACRLSAERPQYLRAMQRTERRWGVPVHVQMATFHQESRFVGNARPPHRYALGIIPMGRVSSAYGYSQALDGTWHDYRRATGRRFARRTDTDDAADFMAQGQGQRGFGSHAVVVKAQIRMAHPASGHLDQHFAGTGLG